MSAIRHTIRTRQRVVALRKLGWSYSRIRRILADEGFDPVPSSNTMSMWTNPDAAERKSRRDLAREDRVTFLLKGRSSPEYRAEFVRRLDKAGVSVDSIGKVCAIVLGDGLTDDELWLAIDGVAA